MGLSMSEVRLRFSAIEFRGVNTSCWPIFFQLFSVFNQKGISPLTIPFLPCNFARRRKVGFLYCILTPAAVVHKCTEEVMSSKLDWDFGEVTKMMNDARAVILYLWIFVKLSTGFLMLSRCRRVKYMGSMESIDWIQNWFSHRRQTILVVDCLSDWRSIISGVLHGLVLGSLVCDTFKWFRQKCGGLIERFADDIQNWWSFG